MTAVVVVPLDTLAKEIEASFAAEDKAMDKAKQHRISTGMRLIEARQRVEAGEAGEGVGWIEWCRANVKRSIRDIQRVMRIARAEDTEAAVEAEKAANREAQAAKRARDAEATDVSRMEDDPQLIDETPDELEDDEDQDNEPQPSGITADGIILRLGYLPTKDRSIVVDWIRDNWFEGRILRDAA